MSTKKVVADNRSQIFKAFRDCVAMVKSLERPFGCGKDIDGLLFKYSGIELAGYAVFGKFDTF